MAGVDHRYDGDFEFFVGGGVAAFDCDDDGRPDLFFAGGSETAALYRNDSAIGRRAAVHPARSPRHRPRRGHRRLPDRRRQRRAHRPRGAAPRRGRDVARPRRLRVRGANESLGLDGGDVVDRRRSARCGRARTQLPTLAFGNYLEPDRRRAPTADCSGRRQRATATRRRFRWRPATARCRSCSATGVGRVERDLRMTNDRHYYRDGEDQLWRIVARATPHRRTPRPTGGAAADLGHGHRQPGRHGRRPARGVPHEPGRQQAADARGRRRPRPTYEDIALARGVTAQRPFAGGDVLPSTAWHAEFADVNNDGFIDLFVTKGNVEAQPEYATRDPNNLLHRPGRRHVRRRRGGGRNRRASTAPVAPRSST